MADKHQPSTQAEAQSESTSPERLRELAQDPELVVAVAGNIVAPPELLTELYEKYRQEEEEEEEEEESSQPILDPILRACAQNPNTPKETLLKLGEQFPAELINNPVFDLLLVENPNLCSEMSGETAEAILSLPDCPKHFWNLFASSHPVVVAKNPNCSVDLLRQLTYDGNQRVLIWAARNSNCPLELLEQLVDKVDDEDHRNEVLAEIALNPSCSSKRRNQIIRTDEYGYVCEHIAENPKCPYYLLCELAFNYCYRVRRSVISNANSTIGIVCEIAKNEHSKADKHYNNWDGKYNPMFDVLAEHPESEVRQEVAKNPRCPLEVLTKLAADQDPYVRFKVVKNRNCPAEFLDPNNVVELLTDLAKDERWQVRKEVASYRNCPVELLTDLAKDEQRQVRKEVAENTNCPVEILSTLTQDKIKRVRSAAEKNLDRLSHKKHLSEIHENPTEDSLPLKVANKTFVLTGTLPNLSRSDATKLIELAGGKVTGSISSKTDYLVAGEKAGSKAGKAKALQIPILSEAELLELLKSDN